MLLNVIKSEYILIATRHRLSGLTRQLDIRIGDCILKRVRSTKTLGVIIDEGLTWSEHIAHVCKKANRGLAAMRCARSFVPAETLMNIYQTMVLPHLDYCAPVWDTCGKGLRDRVQKIQNRAGRIITRCDYSVRSKDILQSLGWDDIGTRHLKQKLITMYKTLNNEMPKYLHDFFQYVSEAHKHNLRGSHSNLTLPRPRTNYLKNSFKYSGAVSWNSLPLNVRESSSVMVFKNKLNQIL